MIEDSVKAWLIALLKTKHHRTSACNYQPIVEKHLAIICHLTIAKCHFFSQDLTLVNEFLPLRKLRWLDFLLSRVSLEDEVRLELLFCMNVRSVGKLKREIIKHFLDNSLPRSVNISSTFSIISSIFLKNCFSLGNLLSSVPVWAELSK